MGENQCESKQTNVDDILTKFNLLGRYHLGFIILVFISNLSSNVYCANYIFVVGKVDYRCKDEGFSNSMCSSNNSTGRCTEWIYDDPHSFVAEFQLACQDWKRVLVGSVNSFGYMVGLVFVGPLSDRLGRKKTGIVCGILGGACGLTKSFANSYWFFNICEFLGSMLGDSYSPFYIMTIEMVSHEKRVFTKMICTIGCSFGYTVLSLAAWFIPYWRHLLRALYAPAFLFFIYAFLMDESPRWLLSKGRKKEAVAILQKAAKTNKIELDLKDLDSLFCEQKKRIPLLQLLKETFKSRELLQRFFICIIWWLTCTFVSYGMKINAVLLPGNKYVNYALITVIDAPAKLMIAFILIRFRRKIPLMSCFIISTVFIAIQSFVPQNVAWLSIALFMASQAMVSGFFATTYIYTTELFPTYTRNSMHALCSSLGRIGSILAPQTPLLVKYWEGLPSLAFGGASLVAGLATMFVPDTAEESLPDTVHQAETIGTNVEKAELSDKTCTRF